MDDRWVPVVHGVIWLSPRRRRVVKQYRKKQKLVFDEFIHWERPPIVLTYEEQL